MATSEWILIHTIMYTNLHTKIFSLKHGKLKKNTNSRGDNEFSFETTENSRILEKYKRFNLGLKRQKIVRMHKTCLTSQFLRLSLARFFCESEHAISRENLANESLKNCDVRQVLCILTIFCRFKPKNVCIFPTFSSFQLFQSEIILLMQML